MPRRIRTIRGLLLAAALVFSGAVVVGAYVLFSSIYDRSVRESAAADANTFAEVTFHSMFQLMSTGWSREQLESFVAGLRQAVANSRYQIDIYRGPRVSELFGQIPQKEMDGLVQEALATGSPVKRTGEREVRYVFPLRVEEACLRCHINAKPQEVLGAIDVRQDVGPLIEENKRRFMLGFLPLLPLAVLGALLMVGFINRRLRGSISVLEREIRSVNRIADLRRLETRTIDFGFTELAPVAAEFHLLTDKLRSIAVDKEMLEFEIQLLEKFIITSEVVKDWREYVKRLVVDINNLIEAYALFSIFKMGDERFNLEMFWRHRPSERTKRMFEASVRSALQRNDYFSDSHAVHIEHTIADPIGELPELSEADIELQTKSLLVAAPKIGGIVGIGVQAEMHSEPTRVLVIESILSTLLNVVGSVKAIHKYTKDLEYYATRDPLTNLYNQRVFWELLDNEIVRAARHGYKFSLLVIDCDNFKSVNDTYGHAFGDTFLQVFAGAVKGAIRADDMLARYGGDEFVVILPESDLAHAETTAERILESLALTTAEATDGKRIRTSASIGISTYPDHAVDRKDLFLFADNMMYRAKADGKARVAVPTEQDLVEVFRTIGEKSFVIVNAVDERRVLPYFQPIHATAGGGLVAVEVLSRILLKDDMVMAAEEFVAIAEKMGVMHKLDYILMEQALEVVRNEDFQGQVFLNMSPRALVLNDFIREARRIAEGADIAPSRIVFEITERETIKNMALLEKFIYALRAEGFQLAIDDFGSGFSSFHYVKRFPIDYLKIEGDFILGMVENDKDRALVRSIVTLAGELGIRTVAEYVETEEVLEAVRAQGIHLAQGYHIRRPLPFIAAAEAAA